jgi:hypothetical protein
VSHSACQIGEWLGAPELPVAHFTALPPHKILTLNMDVPESWLVEPVRAEYDLDNLRLGDLGAATTLDVGFELEALMLTGSCIDVSAKTRSEVRSCRTKARARASHVASSCAFRCVRGEALRIGSVLVETRSEL